MYLFYSLIYIIAIIFIFPFEYFKRPKDLRKRWLREKFGLINGEHRIKNAEHLWIHAVSVGEVMAASALLKKLRERYPAKSLIFSTITDTGQKVARERAPEGTTVVYLPFDIPSVLRRVLKKLNPELLLVIETELWPNLIRVFQENGTPVLLLNGRISEKSFRGYWKISFFMKKVLSHVDFFGMQGEEYSERIKSLGVNRNKVMNIGNFKFDTKPPAKIPEWTDRLKGPVITAGSTHEGEEELLASVYIELKKDFPDVNLIIAPRHPERFKAAEDMLRAKGISFIKRSAFSTPSLTLPPRGGGQGWGGPELRTPNSELQILKGVVILLDTIGELSAVYGISDIAIIGKSFRGHGGQNPLEPAYWGKPVVCGPHMENFPVIEKFYKEGAAVEVHEEELSSKLRELLLSPEKARDMGLKAQELYKESAGAVERAMEIIAGYLK